MVYQKKRVVEMVRRLKKRTELIHNAVQQGINTTGSLLRTVYGAAPTSKKMRLVAVRLRYAAISAIHDSPGRPRKGHC
ncbi:MAG: hypothetical protein HPY81_08520 [Firmicutes bacterium]|nr:hypothetical protein [Bacillota bacterium]